MLTYLLTYLVEARALVHFFRAEGSRSHRYNSTIQDCFFIAPYTKHDIAPFWVYSKLHNLCIQNCPAFMSCIFSRPITVTLLRSPADLDRATILGIFSQQRRRRSDNTRIALSFSIDRVNGEYAGEHKAQFLTGISGASVAWPGSSSSAQRNTVLPDCTLMFKRCHGFVDGFTRHSERQAGRLSDALLSDSGGMPHCLRFSFKASL